MTTADQLLELPASNGKLIGRSHSHDQRRRKQCVEHFSPNLWMLLLSSVSSWCSSRGYGHVSGEGCLVAVVCWYGTGYIIFLHWTCWMAPRGCIAATITYLLMHHHSSNLILPLISPLLPRSLSCTPWAHIVQTIWLFLAACILPYSNGSCSYLVSHIPISLSTVQCII